MGTKPFLWLSGLLLAGLALPGCCGSCFDRSSAASPCSKCDGLSCQKSPATTRTTKIEDPAPTVSKTRNTRETWRTAPEAGVSAGTTANTRRPLSGSTSPASVLDTAAESQPPALERATKTEVEAEKQE